MTGCKIIVGAGAVCSLEINYKNGLSQSKCGFLAAVGQFVRDNFFFYLLLAHLGWTHINS